MPRQVTRCAGGLNLCADKVPKRATLSWPGLTGHFLPRTIKDGSAGLRRAKWASAATGSSQRMTREQNPARFSDNVPILFLTQSRKGLCSASSGPGERGERDRHVRGAGCGGRQGWGVARCLEEARLRAGRIGARPATGAEMSHLRNSRSRKRVTDDPLGGVRDHAAASPGPSPWAKQRGSDRSPGQAAAPEHRVRNAGLARHSGKS
jgi:hypothetical protein